MKKVIAKNQADVINAAHLNIYGESKLSKWLEANARLPMYIEACIEEIHNWSSGGIPFFEIVASDAKSGHTERLQFEESDFYLVQYGE